MGRVIVFCKTDQDRKRKEDTQRKGVAEINIVQVWQRQREGSDSQINAGAVKLCCCFLVL
jgi:hypothetical protein